MTRWAKKRLMHCKTLRTLNEQNSCRFATSPYFFRMTMLGQLVSDDALDGACCRRSSLAAGLTTALFSGTRLAYKQQGNPREQRF